MKFRVKLVLVNTAIWVVAMLLLVFVVTQSIYSYLFNNQVRFLSFLSDEFSALAESAVRDASSTESPALSYRALSDFLCEEILLNYSLPSVLFDERGEVISSSMRGVPGAELSVHVKSSAAQSTKGYVYLEASGVSYIVFIAPVTVFEETVGYSAVFFDTAAIDGIAREARLIFTATIILITAAILAAYSISYKRMLRPIGEISSFMRSVSKNGGLGRLEIEYGPDDEIRDLIDGSNAMIATVQDSLDELNYEKSKLISVIESMQDAVVAVNLSKDMLTTNEKFNEFFPSDTDYIKVVSAIDDLIKKVDVTKESVISEFPLNGETYLMSANRISSPDKENGALIVIKNVTALKQMEADQSKFISSVSHELRTPLTTINGYVDLLQRRGVEDRELTAKALETTRAETNRLLRMVNDILNINKYKTAGFELIFSDVDVDALLAEAVAEMNLRAEASGVLVEYHRTGLPAVRCDRDRIKQVFTNIIDNAVKYSNPDSIVKVMAAAPDEHLEVMVRDYGSGIPEEAREKVFDTFYRVEEDRSRLRGGFGLGLSVVRNIVAKHGGTVSLESQMDQGTMVTIRIPLRKETADV